MNKNTRSTSLLLAALALLASLETIVVHAQGNKIAARPLTPQEIKDYALPTATQPSGGLYTVGVGQPVYLEVEVQQNLAGVTGVNWNLATKPLGSAAALQASPLPTNMPIYSPGDRGALKIVGDRMLLRPDLTGNYLITAQVLINGGGLMLTQAVSGGTYMGNNFCQLCHSGGFLPDTMGPWSLTAHAGAFSNAIDGISTTHFSQNCIKCHSVGYDTFAGATNGGFDDIQALTGWTFPGELTNGNFAAMPQSLREKSNVQCENCHGPGSEHAYSLGDIKKISVSMSAGDCAQCHDSEPYHLKAQEWNNSRHAIATRYPTGESRSSCVRCHSGLGFVDMVDGKPQRTDYEALTCAVCHDPHGPTNNPSMLRKVGPVTLADNITTITNGGKGQLCISCHIGRRDAVTYVETTTGSGNFGPHYGVQGDMIAGANAVTYGKEIASSAHGSVVPETCVGCHLQEVSASAPYFGNVGGHTFLPAWDGPTADPADDIHLTGLCTGCHGPIESFDFKRQDYDGDGVTEGVQTEVKGLLDQLGMLLPPIGSPTVTVTASYTKSQLRAAFNHKFVKDDGSYGVHNLSYAVGLLKASIADLTDDADHDGVSDTWEIAKFGSLIYDGNDDNDNDGVKNALELAAGTNPLVVDSDGDGVSDYAELQAGSDPMNASDIPGFIVQIYNAAEVEFASQVGLKYQVQKVSELTGTWMNMGSITNGTGNNISMPVSTRNGGAQNFFRVVQAP